jgi:hypothetical protein
MIPVRRVFRMTKTSPVEGFGGSRSRLDLDVATAPDLRGHRFGALRGRHDANPNDTAGHDRVTDPELWGRRDRAGTGGDAGHADHGGIKHVTYPPTSNPFHGAFLNDETTLTLGNLPTHTEIVIELTFYAIGTMDGNNTQFGPDIVEFRIDNASVFKTTFLNVLDPDFPQAFPDNYPGGSTPPHRLRAASVHWATWRTPGSVPTRGIASRSRSRPRQALSCSPSWAAT